MQIEIIWNFFKLKKNVPKWISRIAYVLVPVLHIHLPKHFGGAFRM